MRAFCWCVKDINQNTNVTPITYFPALGQ